MYFIIIILYCGTATSVLHTVCNMYEFDDGTDVEYRALYNMNTACLHNVIYS